MLTQVEIDVRRVFGIGQVVCRYFAACRYLSHGGSELVGFAQTRHGVS